MLSSLWFTAQSLALAFAVVFALNLNLGGKTIEEHLLHRFTSSSKAQKLKIKIDAKMAKLEEEIEKQLEQAESAKSKDQLRQRLLEILKKHKQD